MHNVIQESLQKSLYLIYCIMSLNYTIHCINASAGSGKTTHLVNQILTEASKTQSFEHILCLTFSNAAAQELMNRIFKHNIKLTKPYKWNHNLACTLHAFCLTLLHYYNPHYQILTPHMQQVLWTKSLNTCSDQLAHLSYKQLKILTKYVSETHIPDDLKDIYTLIYNTFNQYKTYESLISFDEIIAHTQNLLIKDMLSDGLYNSLSHIKYLYIDESQDLSTTQWEIINSLINEIIQINHLEIILVGDKMQSIYSFQGANPRSYEIFQEVHHDIHLMHQSQNYHKQSMSHSYRYGSNVTQLVNNIFDLQQTTLSDTKDNIEFWEPADDWKDRIRDKILHVINMQSSSSINHQPHTLSTLTTTCLDSKTIQAEKHEAEHENHRGHLHKYIDEHIGNIVKSTKEDINNNPEKTHTIPSDLSHNINNPSVQIHFSDIIILIRKRNKRYLELAQVLRAAGIPVSYDENTDICKNILYILSKILATSDNNKLPLYNKKYTNTQKSDQVSDINSSNYATVVEQEHESILTNDENTDSNLLTIEQILELATLINTPLSLIHTMLQYLRLQQKTQHAILFQLSNFLISHGNSLYACKLFFESNPHFDSSSDSAVRIQTIHSTKGMEANIIFLCDTMQNPNFDTLSHNITRETALEEYKRLLYVALTRTKQSLIIVNNPETYKLSNDSWYSMIKTGMLKLIGNDN